MKIDFKKQYPGKGSLEYTTIFVVEVNPNEPVVITIEKATNGIYWYSSNECWLENEKGDIKECLTPEQLFDDKWLEENDYYWDHP